MRGLEVGLCPHLGWGAGGVDNSFHHGFTHFLKMRSGQTDLSASILARMVCVTPSLPDMATVNNIVIDRNFNLCRRHLASTVLNIYVQNTVFAPLHHSANRRCSLPCPATLAVCSTAASRKLSLVSNHLCKSSDVVVTLGANSRVPSLFIRSLIIGSIVSLPSGLVSWDLR